MQMTMKQTKLDKCPVMCKLFYDEKNKRYMIVFPITYENDKISLLI